MPTLFNNPETFQKLTNALLQTYNPRNVESVESRVNLLKNEEITNVMNYITQHLSQDENARALQMTLNEILRERNQQRRCCTIV